MSNVSVHTHFNIDIDFETPPFHKRLLSWFLDLLVQLIYLIVSLKVMNNLRVSHKLGDSGDLIVALVVVLPIFFYHIIIEIVSSGQSVGKMITGTRVISDMGGRPSVSQYIIRGLIRTGDVAIVIYFFIFVFMGVGGLGSQIMAGSMIILFFVDVILVNSKKQQRLGDILAGTMLVNTRQKEMISDTIFRDVASTYVPSFPQVMKLTDRDINSLKDILEVSLKRMDHRLAAMAAGKIQAHLGIQTSLDDMSFLQVLLTDYNYLTQHS